MPRLVAAIDADVLVPILSCDFLLTAFDLGLYEPVVSVETLVEVERNLLADFPHLDPVAVRRRVGQMRDALDDHLVDPASFDDVPDAINPKDRHVIGAALGGEASTVVTNDKGLRAEVALTDLELVAMSADAFAAHLWQVGPDDVEAVITTLVAKRTTRPVAAEEIMAAMSGPFPTMSAAWSAASSGDVDR